MQKKELQSLQQMSLQEIQAHKQEVLRRKAELEALKTKGGKAWTDALQDELNDLVVYMVDVDDVVDEKAKNRVPKGTENMVHLSIVHGHRFNPNTGKEISKPYTQMFTYGEWQLFKAHFHGLGYAIIEVIHDPYGEAEKFVTENK